MVTRRNGQRDQGTSHFTSRESPPLTNLLFYWSGHILQAGTRCPQRYRPESVSNVAPGLQPARKITALTKSSPLSTRWAKVLERSTLPSCYTGLQLLTGPNPALTQRAHDCAAHSHVWTGHSTSETSAAAGQSLRLHAFGTQSFPPWCKRAPTKGLTRGGDLRGSQFGVSSPV